jgi:hypothetical protein
MLFKDINPVYTENHTRTTNTKAQLPIIKYSDTYSSYRNVAD